MDTVRSQAIQTVSSNSYDFYDDDERQNAPPHALMTGLVRQWRIVLGAFVLVCLMGLPALWILKKPYYQATAAIRVTPVVSSILFQGENSVPMYRNFVRTQADLMISDVVLKRVAEELSRQNILQDAGPRRTGADNIAANPNDGPVGDLKRMVISRTLRVEPEDSTELIKITMKSSRPEEAAIIVNTFLKEYMALVTGEESQWDDDKLAILQNEAKALQNKLQRQRRAVNEMTEEYGTASLNARQQMKLDRISALQSRLTEFEMEKIALQIKEQLLANGEHSNLSPHELVRLRYEFVNADLMVKTLTMNTAQLEQDLIIARQRLAPTNPELDRKEELTQTLKERLSQRQKQVAEEFDKMVEQEFIGKETDQLASVRAQLQRINSYQARLEQMLSAEDHDAIAIGRRQLAIDDLASQYAMTKDLYDAVQRRVQEIEVERKRPARISSAYYANTAPLQDKRKKYSLAIIFGAMALSGMVGALRNRFDDSLHTPADVVRSAGLRILGTTTRSRDVEEAFLSEHFMNDYQTICANLGLLNQSGIPAKIIIASPRDRDGKTTLAINLSVTLAKMGKKVLLIDGDMRKADIAYLLKLWGASNGLKNVLLGESPEQYICHTSVDGLDLLPSNPCESSVIYNLMAPERLKDSLDYLSTQYDHVMVDTPAALDVPDALLWSTAADAVILAAYAGQTRSADVRETLFRLQQLKVPVLGVVLNSVSPRQSYNSYRCYAEATSTLTPHLDGAGRAHLLPMGDQDDRAEGQENSESAEYAVSCDT